MYILSEEQFKWLLTLGGFNVNRLSASNNEISILGRPLIRRLHNQYILNTMANHTVLLSDIGAGDGEVTMRLVKGIVHMKNNIFLKVFATEYSWTMRDRLQEKQFMWAFTVVR